MGTSGWLKDETRAAAARHKSHPQTRTRSRANVPVGMIPNLLTLESMRPPPRDEYIERQALGLMLLWWDSKPSMVGPAIEFLEPEDFSCWGLPVIYAALRTAWRRGIPFDLLATTLAAYGLFEGSTGIQRADVASLVTKCDGFWWDMKYYRRQLRGLRLRRGVVRMSSVLMSKAYSREPDGAIADAHVRDWITTARNAIGRMDALTETYNPVGDLEYWTGEE